MNHPPSFSANRRRECGASQGERAADRECHVVQPFRVPFLDVEIEAGEPVVFVCHR
jgi:hypothetical protein